MNQYALIKKKDENGYIKVQCDEGWVLEHRKVVEDFIGRKLTDEEVIHHIDCNRANNSINNLMIFPNQKAHASFHQKFDKFGLNNKQIRNLIAFRWKDYKPPTIKNAELEVEIT